MKLVNGNCVEEMQKLIDAGVHVDLTVTSPPYDSLRSYEDSLDWNFDIFKQVADKLYNITIDGGVVVWIVNDATINGSETGTSFKQALHFKKIGFRLHDTMIYQKTGIPYPEVNRYYPQFEYMFILSKGKPKTTNLIKDRKNKYARQKITGTNRQVDGTFRKSNSNKLGKRIHKYGVRFNVWKYNTGKGHTSKNPITFQHPATFPLNLARDHVISWSNKGDTVLDCFMGSGTTGVACQQLTRKFIGIEIVEKYFKIAEERCKHFQSRLV